MASGFSHQNLSAMAWRQTGNKAWSKTMLYIREHIPTKFDQCSNSIIPYIIYRILTASALAQENFPGLEGSTQIVKPHWARSFVNTRLGFKFTGGCQYWHCLIPNTVITYIVYNYLNRASPMEFYLEMYTTNSTNPKIQCRSKRVFDAKFWC